MSEQHSVGGQTNHANWTTRVAWMSLIAATGVGVIYVPQPIQTLVAADFAVESAWVSAATVSVQLGYALGVLFLVALGDRYSARRQVTTQLALTAIALALTAASPSYVLVVVLMGVAGAAATIGQILVAAALRLSPPEVRARTTATIVGSIGVGLFTVRTTLGSLAEAIGWRGALLVVALLVVALIPVSLRFSPAEAPVNPPRYGAILRSLPRVAGHSATLRTMAAIHMLTFSGFIALWSMSAVHAVNVLGLSVTAAALLGLAGLAGGATTILVASWHTRVGPSLSLIVSMGAGLVATVLVLVATNVIWALVIAFYLISFSMTSEQVATQATGLRSVDPAESGRANTVFMATAFLGSSLVTAAAAVVYQLAGYAGAGVLAFACVLVGTLVALAAYRRGYFTQTPAVTPPAR